MATRAIVVWTVVLSMIFWERNLNQVAAIGGKCGYFIWTLCVT